MLRRWSLQIVGLHSNREIELRFCRFYTRRAAEAFAARLDAQVLPEIERLTEVRVIYRPWTERDRWMVVGAAVGALLGALAAALVLLVW